MATTSIMELPEDIVCDILSKIFNQSNKDFGIVDWSIKRFIESQNRLLFFKNLKLRNVFKPPYNERYFSKHSNFVDDCVLLNNNVEAMFLSGINELYFKRDKHKGIKISKHAASYMHAKSMYILAFLLEMVI